MVAIANRIPWLCTESPCSFEDRGEEFTIKSLIQMLKTEIQADEWNLIYINIENK